MKIKIKISLAVIVSLSIFIVAENLQAANVVYNVPFATDMEGFTYITESCKGTCTNGYIGTDGNPAGAIFDKNVGRKTRSLGYFTKNLTWEAMGVPVGGVVTDVDGRFDTRLFQETHAATQSVGLKLYDNADTTIILTGGVDLETEFDCTSPSWITRNTDGAKTVLGTYQASSTPVTIRMRSDLNTGNNATATTEIRFDNLYFSINYNAPPTLSISQPDGVGDTVVVGSPYGVTYSLADADDVVTTAFYYDNDNTGLNGTAIAGACAAAAEGTNATCSWDTTGMTPGSYYIYGITSGGVNPSVSAYSVGQITINATAGSLSVDVVDSGGTPVASPAVSFTNKTFDWIAQTSNGTLGISSQKIRVNNTTVTPSWTLSMAATSGPTVLWQSGGDSYDFNDSSANGRLQVDASSSTITPQSGCSTTGLTKNSTATYFAQGSQDSINLVTAGGSAQIGCYWDITGIILTQDIPAGQVAGNYSIGMTLTAT